MSQQIYLDHFATTPMLPEAWDAMRPFVTETFGNPSSSHTFGRKARRSLEDARERIAALLGASADEVIFTSGATEANNLAILGLAGSPPGRVVAGPTEHPCVAGPLKRLAESGFDVTELRVGGDGVVTLEEIPEARLLTMMLVNHETGAITNSPRPPQRTGGEGVKAPRLTHTDAAQAVGKIPVHFHDFGVDALTASGHKFGGPKGIGVLLLKRGTALRPMFLGGHQQQGRRPGTEPVALAVGMATALDIACRNLDANRRSVESLREGFLGSLRAGCPPVVINGPEDPSRRVPHVANVSFPGCRADLLLMKLDLAGVACSTGSACSSGSLLPSPVLKAMGVPDDVLRSAMRFSFSPGQTPAEIGEAASRIADSVNGLRGR